MTGASVSPTSREALQAAFTGNEFVSAPRDANNQRLDDAALADRFDEVAELVVTEFRPWLERAPYNLVQGDLLDALTLFRGG